MNETHHNRRFFLKTALLSLLALPFLGRLGFSADAELPFLKDGEKPGDVLDFTADADKPGKKSAARKAKDKSKQYCYNCQLFTKLDGDKKKATGKCMIIAKHRVHGNGWCKSWVQNVNVKD